MTRPNQPQPASIPSAQAAAAASSFWSAIDVRAQTAVQDFVKQNLGVPRARSMTITIPLGQTTPGVGWFTSIMLFQNVRVSAWVIQALAPGVIDIDLQVTPTYVDPALQPLPISIINNAANLVDALGNPLPGTYLSMNGYTAYSYDTSNWVARDIPGASNLHVFIVDATGVAQATLGLQLMDLQGKTMQV